MSGTARNVGFTVTLDTRTGVRQVTGTATTYNHLSDEQAKAGVAQYATAGTSTPVKRVDLHPGKEN